MHSGDGVPRAGGRWQGWGAKGRGTVAGACFGEPSEVFEQGGGLIRMTL